MVFWFVAMPFGQSDMLPICKEQPQIQRMKIETKLKYPIEIQSHPGLLYFLTCKRKKCFLFVSQRRSQSTSASRPPTEGKGADTTHVPVTLTGPHGTLTMSTTPIVNTPTGDTTTTGTSTTMKTRAAQGIRSTLTPQVCTFSSFEDGLSWKHKI